MNTFTKMAEDWIRQHGPEIERRASQPPSENPDDAKLVDCEMPGFDPSEWAIELITWVSTQCVLRDRCFGGVGSLHIHFSEWCVRSGSVPCSRQTFEWLLRDQGFKVADGLTYGLILAADGKYRQQHSAEDRA
jgi:hypothetical protein